ncbi:MAG: YhfC family intramembrane metalloprotease [Bacteroidales bacterium]|nr:YhfC family intramembrane metalloprotease [Bacteroidales bacterium]
MVPTSSLVLMAVNAALGILIPVGLAWWLVRKYQARLSTVLIGAGTFIVFAMVLEGLMHQLVLKGPHGPAILGNTLWYALYGGIAAGVFEETGRFLSMKFLIRREPSTLIPGLAYGAGHGGAEMLVIFGLTMISNLVVSLMINTGHTDVFSTLQGDAGAQIQAALDQLRTLAPYTLIMGLWERLSALILHLGLSLIVWTAVRRGGKYGWLFPAAIVLHAAVDAGAVLLQKSVSMAVLEMIIFIAASAVASAGLFSVTQSDDCR